MTHGIDCKKVPHVATGYLHSEDDDTPYDVDGVFYCGRCHYYLSNYEASLASEAIKAQEVNNP